MKFKEGVKLHGIRPEMVAAFPAIEAARAAVDGAEATITSVCEGKHSAKSKHYIGCAVDVRTRDLPTFELDLSSPERRATPEALAEYLRERLQAEFDVVVERDHIHVEWDPKR